MSYHQIIFNTRESKVRNICVFEETDSKSIKLDKEIGLIRQGACDRRWNQRTCPVTMNPEWYWTLYLSFVRSLSRDFVSHTRATLGPATIYRLASARNCENVSTKASRNPRFQRKSLSRSSQSKIRHFPARCARELFTLIEINSIRHNRASLPSSIPLSIQIDQKKSARYFGVV